MRVIHHCIKNGSGLNRIATDLALFERKLGIDSVLSYTNEPLTEIKVEGETESMEVVPQAKALEADVHVIHSHLPDGAKGKTVFFAHGTPEHCFQTTIEQFGAKGHVAGDPWMLSLHRLNTTDITVTFWPRHAYIWQSMNPKADVRVIPMGVDLELWQAVPSKGKWAGNPSLFTCENCHNIKWPLDLILAFPLIMRETKAVLHIHYLPLDQHRWWYPLLQANGTAYKSYTSGGYFSAPELKNAFCSVDYYISPVRYGDFNSVCLEAKAAGCKVISYRGNPYADFWITEGDQVVMAQELIDIFSGKTSPRTPSAVPSDEEMAAAMAKIYEKLK